MPVAVDIELTDAGNRAIGVIGKKDLDLTAVDATTAAVRVSGRPVGRIRNRSGASITVTLLELEDVDGEMGTGTALTCYDEDPAEITSKTIPNLGSMQLPSGLAGIEWLVLKLSSGTASVNIVVHR